MLKRQLWNRKLTEKSKRLMRKTTKSLRNKKLLAIKKQLNGIKRTMIVNLMKLKRLSRQFGRNIKCHIQDPIWMKSERCLSQQKVFLEQ